MHARTRVLLMTLLAGSIVPALCADAVIIVRLSYKVILSPVDGLRPPDFTEAGIDQAIADMNELSESYGRGYRFVRVDPLLDVGNVGGFQRPSPSRYFFIEMFQNTTEYFNMLADAQANGGPYAWNPGAINIYINRSSVAATCVFPARQLSVIGAAASDTAEVTLDELGHYFNLCHTHGCQCACCDPFEQGTCHTVPGDDGVLDTLPDLPCWSLNQIAQHNFGAAFADLTPSQQEQVRNVFFNIMSFHGRNCGTSLSGVSRFTERQLDRWADAASTDSRSVCDGSTYFVRAGPAEFENGRSTNPFNTVAEGLSAALSGGDILMIRGGTYPENLTLSAPVTLRAPRGQVARIGQ